MTLGAVTPGAVTPGRGAPAARRSARGWAIAATGAALAGCSGMQSTLDPAGEAADRVATLFWIMLAGAAMIWTGVMATAIATARRKGPPVSQKRAQWFIIGAGAVFPTLVLTLLLSHGLRLMPELRAGGGDLKIRVQGEQFWWRVTYLPEGGPPVVSANELRLPAGAVVELELTSPDVIHSFWIPAIAGKTDMIPGRVTRQLLKPVKPGLYRGACAEFCGTGHTLMAFTAEVMPAEDFARWLAAEGRDAAPPAPGSAAARGARVFDEQGCGACHSIRGTGHRGTIGPDLTHLGSRHSIGAGILPNTGPHIADFIRATATVKPGVLMPAYGGIGDDDLSALAAYLEGLQ